MAAQVVGFSVDDITAAVDHHYDIQIFIFKYLVEERIIDKVLIAVGRISDFSKVICIVPSGPILSVCDQLICGNSQGIVGSSDVTV